MSWEQRLHRALDKAPDAPHTVVVENEGTSAEIDVVRVDPIGVRLRGVRVKHAEPRDVAAEADRLGRDLRALPDRVAPVEVDPQLGGAILRTRPDELRRREFYEVRVEPQQTEARKVRVGPEGREDAEMDVTREQLGRLIEELG